MIKFIIHCLIAALFTTYIMATDLKNVTADTNVDELWILYKTEHKRNYEEAEEAERFGIFKENVKKIVEHNEKYANGEVTFTMGINQFTDKKPGEWRGGVLKPDATN